MQSKEKQRATSNDHASNKIKCTDNFAGILGKTGPINGKKKN